MHATIYFVIFIYLINTIFSKCCKAHKTTRISRSIILDLVNILRPTMYSDIAHCHLFAYCQSIAGYLSLNPSDYNKTSFPIAGYGGLCLIRIRYQECLAKFKATKPGLCQQGNNFFRGTKTCLRVNI